MKKCLYYHTILLLLIPSWTLAFDSESTHKQITKNAVENSLIFQEVLEAQLGFEGLKSELSNGSATHSITEWFQTGSEEEDDPACRAANHFHNPLKPWNESMLTDSSSVIDWLCDLTTPFSEKYSNISWATGLKDKEGAPMPPEINGPSAPPDENGRNWIVARNHYYTALTAISDQEKEKEFAETFRTIGYVLHLLEDMAVPAHTRNDFSQGHLQVIGCPDNKIFCGKQWIGNPFEGYVRDNFEKEILPLIAENISTPYTGEKKLTSFWDTDTVLVSDTDIPQTGFDIGLAEYTNANFASHATIFKPETDTEHYFPYPNKDSIAAQDYPIDEQLYLMTARDGKLEQGVYVTKNNHGERIDKFLKLRYVFQNYNSSNWDNISGYYKLLFTLDHECFKDYATKLIPRAVGYSAALLDYFFRGKLEISPPDQYVYTVIDGGEIDPTDNTQYWLC